MIECLVSDGDVCGEGILWHAPQNALYWTDINLGKLRRMEVREKSTQSWEFGQPVTAVSATSDPQKLVVVLGGEIVLWDSGREQIDRILFRLQEWPSLRCNDARVGPDGRLWFGTMQNNVETDGGTCPVTQAVGELLSLSADGDVRLHKQKFKIPNTVAWTPRGDAMLFADTLSKTIYIADFRESFLGAQRIFQQGFSRGLPDGSAMDAEGYLWNCRYGGGCIVRFAPDGSIDKIVESPVPNPTTCAFGGDDLRTLFFTSAAEGNRIERRLPGGVFSMPVEVPGLVQPVFPL